MGLIVVVLILGRSVSTILEKLTATHYKMEECTDSSDSSDAADDLPGLEEEELSSSPSPSSSSFWACSHRSGNDTVWLNLTI